MDEKLISKMIVEEAEKAEILMEVPDEQLFAFGRALVRRIVNTTNAEYPRWRESSQEAEDSLSLLYDHKNFYIGIPDKDSSYLFIPINSLGVPHD